MSNKQRAWIAVGLASVNVVGMMLTDGVAASAFFVAANVWLACAFLSLKP